MSEPYFTWRDSECAGFIRSILEDRANRDTTRLAFADWLEEHGNHARARDLRDPAGYWQDDKNGVVSWNVDPWHEHRKGIGGIGFRIDVDWWACDHPSKEWLRSEGCKRITQEWVKNGVAARSPEYPWLPGVIARLDPCYQRKYADDLEYNRKLAEWAREAEERQEAKDREDYKRLWKKFKGQLPEG